MQKFFVSVSLAIWAATMSASAGWEGQLTWAASPNTTNSAWTQWRGDAIAGLATGGVSNGTFVPLLVGNRTAATVLANGGGFQIRAGFWIRSETPFYPSNVTYSLGSSDPQNLLRFEGNFPGLSVSRQGKGLSGEIRTEGNPLVTEIWGVGVANGFRADTADDLKQIADFLDRNRPWSACAEYRVLGTEIVASNSLPFNFQPPRLEMRLAGGRPRLFAQGPGGGTLQIFTSSNPLSPRDQWERFSWLHQPGEEEILLPVPVSWGVKVFTADWLPDQ